MDTLFENQYTHSKQYYKEFYSYFYFKKPLSVAALTFFSLLFVFSIVSFVFSFRFVSNGVAVIYIFMSALVWLIRLLQYRRAVNSRYKQELEMGDGKPFEVILIVTEDGIDACQVSTGNKNHIDFSKIKKTFHTKNYYILMTSAKLCCTFKKDGFVKGDLQAFRSFLKAKGLKAK